MALRKPLVLVGFDPYQLPDGDTLDAIVTGIGADLVNESANNLARCTPVCPGTGAGAGGFQPARANTVGTSRVIGLIGADQIGPGASGLIVNFGILSATTAQWNAITGQNNGLTPGAIYFLSDVVPFRLSTAPPLTTGDFLVRIGQALTPRQMFLNIQPPIGL